MVRGARLRMPQFGHRAKCEANMMGSMIFICILFTFSWFTECQLWADMAGY